MDSLTQLALGSAVGEAVLGHRLGTRRALVWGAVLGTLPDLDVLVPTADPVVAFTYHRSWSHSVFVLAALTPLVVWIARRLHRDTRGPEWRWRWAAMVYAVFVTHVLLDCFTVFGTQVLWPIPRAPESWSTVFIIDPLYTIPLLAGIGWALWRRRENARSRANAAGLVLSTVYLGWSVFAQAAVAARVEEQLAHSVGPASWVHVSPTPFNTVLWRVIAVDADAYRIGYAGVFDRREEVHWTRYERRGELIDELGDAWAADRLAWFTHGFFGVDEIDGDVVFSDLRMGIEPDRYVFRFAVGTRSEAGLTIVQPARRVRSEIDWDRLGWVWRRIWDEDANP